MERLDLRFGDAQNALVTLQEILKEPFSVIVRDASIQRFEYTFEAFWKFIREYLKEKEGLIANSPKTCFRELFALGICGEEESVQLQEMTDKRNDTAHTYKEQVAQAIYETLGGYALLMERVLNEVQRHIQ